MKKYIAIAAICAVLILGGATASKWAANRLLFFDSATGETLLPVTPVAVYVEFTEPGIDTTNDLAFAQVNTGTVAPNPAIGGMARITTGAADDDDCELATELCFAGSKAVSFEARLASNDVTGSGYCVGLTDAKAEGADTLALTYSGTTLTSTASDCAMFFHDPDATTDLIRCVSVKNDTDGTVISTGTAAVNATFHVYRIDIDTSGNVEYWFDGAYVGRQALGITTTDPLCGYVGVINREGAANTLDVDYLRIWQER